MKWVLVAAASALLLAAVAFAGGGAPQWLLVPMRDSLASSGDSDEWNVVYKGGLAVHVQASGKTPFAPQVEMYDGAGTLIDSDYAQAGDTHAVVVMPAGGTVTNILHVYVSGVGAASYPAHYSIWKGLP